MQHLRTGLDLPADGRRACASFCAHVSTCDAYYVFYGADGNDCHLVDYERERYISLAEEASKVLYESLPTTNASEAIRAASNQENAPNLQPCDADETNLDVGSCSALPTEEVTYYQCGDVAVATFAEAVALVSDMKFELPSNVLSVSLPIWPG